MPTDAGDVIARAQAALRAGDPARARGLLAEADDPAAGEVIEGLARASYLELDFPAAIAGWEQAYAAHRGRGDQLGAVRVARTLAYMYGTIVGDGAVMSGWMARARTLLGEGASSAEAGWVSLNTGMFEGDRGLRDTHFRAAREVARQVGDSDLEFVAAAYLGANMVYDDRTDEGMVLLDEALAAVAGSDVDDFCALQEIFCQLFAACERAHDVSRADQWIRIGEAIAARRRLPAVSAFCRTHYGGVLTNAGRWPEADEALTEAVRLWSLGHRSLRAGALVRLADLRVRQGRFEEAEQLLDGVGDDAEAARPRAATQLAAGAVEVARDTIERALASLDPAGTETVPLLGLLVDVHLAAGALPEAERVVRALEDCAARHRTPFVVGTAALARGRFCVATGSGDPRECLRQAMVHFGRAQMPIDVAHGRLELAAALEAEQAPVARAEAQAALEEFERLGAVRHADAAAALLRRLGGRPAPGVRITGVLSKREAEVLDLLSHGLSNPEISDRLFISRKTVEHHVSNILAKLGLRSRAAAAAYASRAKPSEK